MFKSKGAMKIISLLAAIAIWLYVMGEVDPETRAKISDIPVNFANTEILAGYGLAVACDEEVTVSATISGKRSDVNEAKKNGLTATVDVAECDKGENLQKITVNLPAGVSLENVSETTMVVNVEDMVYRSKPVVMEFINTEASDEAMKETIPWVLEYYPETVTVSGAASSVDKVVKLIGVIDPTNAVRSESRWVNVDLIPINSKGRAILNVYLNEDSVEAEIRELTLKSVDLKLITENEELKIADLEVPERVRIAGTKDAIKSIESIEGVVSVYEGKTYIDTDLPEDVFIVIGEENGKIIWN